MDDEWYTPMEIINALGKFDLDPACGPLCENETAEIRYRDGGLQKEWSGRVWLNPPFSNAAPWVERLAEHQNGICLVFARTDAVWFQNAIRRAKAFFMFRGRTAFDRPGRSKPSRCPLGCVLIPFGEQNIKAIERSGLNGVLVRV